MSEDNINTTHTMSLRARIEQSIQDHINDCKEQLIKDAVKEFEQELRNKLAFVVLKVSNYYSIESIGTVLHVKIDTAKANI